jgi:hypothetical protein
MLFTSYLNQIIYYLDLGPGRRNLLSKEVHIYIV